MPPHLTPTPIHNHNSYQYFVKQTFNPNSKNNSIPNPTKASTLSPSTSPFPAFTSNSPTYLTPPQSNHSTSPSSLHLNSPPLSRTPTTHTSTTCNIKTTRTNIFTNRTSASNTNYIVPQLFNIFLLFLIFLTIAHIAFISNGHNIISFELHSIYGNDSSVFDPFNTNLANRYLIRGTNTVSSMG